MARYARIFATIWSDPDFVARTANAQRLYLLLVTQPDVSHCGVLPLTERRWARLALDTDVDSVRAALTELEANAFVIVDEHTEEVLIRSYIKHDGQWASPNGQKAIEKARSRVLSTPLAKGIDASLKALSEGATEPPSQGATGGDASPQQPATSNQQPRSTSQQPATATPPPDRPAPAESPAPDSAAAAFDEAINLAVEHRRAHTANIRNPAGWERRVRPGIIDQHGPRIRQHLDDGDTPEQAIARIFAANVEQATARDLEADHARSAARAHLLTGATPADAYTAAIASYPRQHTAICTELDWQPDTAAATVSPLGIETT